MSCSLSVNINAIAHLRNRRSLPWPDPVELGRQALKAGAKGLTIHPRPDQRHIKDEDVPALEKMLRSEFPKAEFNIEGYPDERFLKLVETYKPDQVTLVPDDPAQDTSDHGWDIPTNSVLLTDTIDRLQKSKLRISLFIDPDQHMVDWAEQLGADRVEIYTGPYGSAVTPAEIQVELTRIVTAGHRAEVVGIGLNAGHDLTRENLPRLVKALPNLLEVSIGHALVGDALQFGMSETVRLYNNAISD